MTVTAFPHNSWRAKAILLPPGDTLVFLVNPCLETAMLRRDGERWRVSTLDPFTAAGMGTDPLDGVIVRPSLSIVLDEDRVSARVVDGERTHEWYVPAEEAQLLRESDLGEARLELIALACRMIEVSLKIKVSDDLLSAAIAASKGNTARIMRLAGQDKRIAALVVAQLYVATFQTAAKQPAPGGGVHVMATDAAEAAEWATMCTALATTTGTTVVRLADAPTAEQRRTEYLADIVVGTPEQFRAAYAFYRDEPGEWGLHETRGRLAMTIGAGVRHRAGDLIRRYPRVAVV